ncbi:MAG: tRNA lysidine(34) synthetase TilS [Bacteroidales bacterium]|jgi:tRNA(Ile)-lysidine synthase|nr:tRNA lysidine(34) synthetase TilS [Bacteroidales bacterium]HOL97928.1 tRNA lysidine(34) synthetase TilS [Bacteroidales bacterium]HOM36397.1 tRNA lysidine(34) synthetase TilS [Bacteroidales bacterium]HPD23564.1 tRNA lysidine(34) synthetase TilS [Bacteroidales bacterium]HRS99130.1 tRNA lysidine(34) synthetase TilS [Bacteroidales bacterium]
MITKIHKNFELNKIVVKSKILCAVSGGIDSSVMLHILNNYGFECIVAHCNFKLRGKESDDDQKFVQQLAVKYDVKFVTIDFDTEKYANSLGISIQMAARDLRYQWFKEMKEKYSCDYIALAHNSDDQIETMLTNLIRGTGVRGLSGMYFLKNDILRPLIYTSRVEIENYAKDFNIDFRNDSTNATTKYSRNKIRHQILPLFEEINPAAKENILKTNLFIKETSEILADYIKLVSEKCTYYKNEDFVIDLNELFKYKSPNTLIFEILINKGIPKVLASEAIQLIYSSSGKYCQFATYKILRNRNEIIVKLIKQSPKQEILIKKESFEKDFYSQGIFAKIVNINDLKSFENFPHIAYFDFDKLSFPLKIRKWLHGDKFKPFGMNNFKKLSNFFNDIKLNCFEKENINILCSADKIVWIIGYRSDNRFKIDNTTKTVLILETEEVRK